MIYALFTPAGWVELPEGAPVVIGDVQASYETMLRDTGFRSKHKIVPITITPLPANFNVTGRRLVDNGGIPTIVWDGTPGTAPVPEVVTWGRFWQACYHQGHCTKAESLAAIRTRQLPNKITNALNTLPAQIQEDVEFAMTGAIEVHRNHPYSNMLGQAMNISPAQMDEVWKLGAQLGEG